MDLTDAESRLVDHAVAGDVLNLTVGDSEVDDPANANEWGDDRRVRGEVVAQLCMGQHGKVHPRGLRVRGAHIVGDIDLTDLEVPHPLWLIACSISEGILTAEAATLRSLQLPGTHVTNSGRNNALALQLASARIQHGLNLANRYRTPHGDEVDVGRFTANGEIWLLGATIQGQLALRGAEITAGDSGRALVADFAIIRGSAFLNDGFTATGEVRLLGATIGGQLAMRGAKLTAGDSGHALYADRATIGGGAFLDGEFTAAGELWLKGATIDGQLAMSGAKLTAGDNGHALNAQSVTIRGGAFLDDGFTATGETRLAGATIYDQLQMSGAELTAGASGHALVADGATIRGDAFLNGEFTATGETRLAGATIDGQLEMRGAELTAGDSGHALVADMAAIRGGAFLEDGFTATGQIRLVGATMDGNMVMSGADLTAGKSDYALVASSATIGGGTFLDDGFTATGALSFSNADLRALLLQGRISGVVDLRRANTDSWSVEFSGSDRRLLLLEGFRYDAIIDPNSAGAPPVDKHLKLLAQDPGYAPGKFNQLADAYRRAGHDPQAGRVLRAKQQSRRTTLPRWRQVIEKFLDVTTAYGTQPWRAAVLLVASILIAWLFYWAIDDPTAMQATTEQPPIFRPLLYAADVTVPVLDFDHRRWWQPATTWVAIVTAIAAAVGWVLSTVTVIGLTGVLGRRD